MRGGDFSLLLEEGLEPHGVRAHRIRLQKRGRPSGGRGFLAALIESLDRERLALLAEHAAAEAPPRLLDFSKRARGITLPEGVAGFAQDEALLAEQVRALGRSHGLCARHRLGCGMWLFDGLIWVRVVLGRRLGR